MSDTKTQARLRPVIRLFVSSTFSDMKHERNALEAEAFPKLEQLCQRHGFQFQAIDLRWGVSTEAGLDHRTMRICFDELRRAQEISPKPNFLILLGNRYGWRPLPEEISVEEFEELKRAATTDHTDGTDEHKSEARDQKPEVGGPSAIREIRETHGQELDPLAVLNAWYRRDDNAVPPVYLLQSRRQDLGDGQDYTHDAVWNQVQAVLWTIINRAMPPEQLQRRFDGSESDGSPPAIVRFQASATEQEIWHGALRVPDAREHVLAFFREIENLDAFSDPTQIKDFVDVDPSGRVEVALQTEQDRLKAELCQRLSRANVFRNEAPARLVEAQDHQGNRTADVTTGHLAQFCADVVNRMSEIIQGQIDEYWLKTAQASTDRAARELEIEQREYERFARERGGEESFVGRQVELQAILDYAGSDSRWPLVIHGASGCGKTALLARAAEQQRSEVGGQSSEIVVRFIGVAPRSSDLRSLLSSLCQELRQRNPRTEALPTEIKELRDEFSQHLQAATPEQPLILFLDALDQLADADNGRLLSWLPLGSLPAHVKIVVSCLSDRAAGDPAGQPYAELKRRQIPAENFINLDVLSEAEARLLLFDRWLPKAGRKVSDNQRARIEQRLASPGCRQPIYLKLLFEEVLLWHSYDPAPVPGESVPALLGQLFDRLSQSTNHGPLLVNRVLGYLSASRYGLAENEILEILFADPEYRAKLNEATEQTRHELPPNAEHIPIALWSRLRFDLAPYLTERAAPGANVLTFYHRQVAEFVRGHLLDTPLNRQKQHQRLAEYFQSQDYFLESLEEQRARAKRLPPTPRPANVRKVDELPWQRLVAAKLSGEWDAVQILFTDLFFLEAKSEANFVFDLVGDFAAAVKSMPAERPKRHILELLAEALHRDIHFIARHPTTVFQCLWNSCWWYDCSETSGHYAAKSGHWDQRGIQLSDLLSTWRRQKEKAQPGFSWLRAHRPPSTHLGTAIRVVFREHEASVTNVSYSPDGRFIVSGSSDKSLRVWDAETSKQLVTLLGHEDGVSSVCVSPDGRIVVSGSRDHTVRVWDVQSGRQLFILRGHEAPVTSVSIAPDSQRIVSGSTHGELRMWDITRRRLSLMEALVRGLQILRALLVPLDGLEIPSIQQLQVLHGHDGSWVNSVSYSADGLRIVSGGSDMTVRVWDAHTGKQLAVLYGHEGQVNSATFSPEGLRVLTASSDKTVRVWDLQNGQQLRLLGPHKHDVRGARFSPDGRRIVVVSWWEKAVEVWDAQSGKAIQVLSGHDDTVSCACFSPEGRSVVSGSDDGTAMVWDVENGHQFLELQSLVEHASTVYDLCFSPGGQCVASVSTDKTVRVWDANSGKQLRLLRSRVDFGDALKFSPDGRCVVSSGRYFLRNCCVWNVEEGTELIVLEGGSFLAPCFSANCQCFAIHSYFDASVRVFDAQSGQQLKVLRWNKDKGREFSFSSDGRRIVTYAWDDIVELWDLRSGKELLVLHGLRPWVTSVGISPNGLHIVTGHVDGTIKVWDTQALPHTTGPSFAKRMLRWLTSWSSGSSRSVVSVGFSPDGLQVASGYSDGLVKVWDAQTDKQIRVLHGQEWTVSTVGFSRDGRYVLSANRGNSDTPEAVRVWNVSNGERLAVIQGCEDIQALAASAPPFHCFSLALGQFETVIAHGPTGETAAWFPPPLKSVAVHPSGRTWAGRHRNHVYIFSLEGDLAWQQSAGR